MKQSLLALFLTASVVCGAQNRQEQNLKTWQFSRDGKVWQQVSVPHDWAINGPFDRKWDIQHLAIIQDGQNKAIDHTGRSGALPWLGEGRYRTVFTVPKGAKRAELYFDGAMSEPVVYVNGQEAGRWNYGYNAFRLDITQLLRRENNEITVRLHNVEESSRWYPGAGLYRPVRLIFTGDIRIDPWETFFRTLSADANNANVSVNTQIKGAKSTKNIKTTVTIKNADGRVVAQKTASPDAQGRASFNLDVAHPQLWSPESPPYTRLSPPSKTATSILIALRSASVYAPSMCHEHTDSASTASRGSSKAYVSTTI